MNNSLIVPVTEIVSVCKFVINSVGESSYHISLFTSVADAVVRTITPDGKQKAWK